MPRRNPKAEVVAATEPFARPAPRTRKTKAPTLAEEIKNPSVDLEEARADLVLTNEGETPPLTTEERVRLERYERIIARGIETFIEVGDALSIIAREKLWRGTDQSFAAYVARRWNWSVRNAYYLMESAETAHRVLGATDNVRYRQEEVVQEDGTTLLVEVSEPIITLQESRELARAAPEEQEEILELVLEQVPPGPERAHAIKEEIDRRKGPRQKTNLELYSEELKAEERARKAKEAAGSPTPFDCPDIIGMRWARDRVEISFRTGKRSLHNIWVTGDELKSLWGMGGDDAIQKAARAAVQA